MLASMLGAHSRILTIPEFHFKFSIVRDFDGVFDREHVPEALERFKKHLDCNEWGIADLLEQTPPERFDGSYRQFVEFLVLRFAAQVGKPEFDYWVDHTPSNIAHSQFLLTQFEDARIIHIVRDGRAVAASVLPLDWGPMTIRRAAEVWMMSLASGLAAEVVFPKDRVMRVHYEDIVRDPQETLGRITAFIGVSYEPGLEEGRGFAVPASGKSQHALVGSRPNPERIEAWRDTLTSRQVQLFEFYAGDMLRTLGYSTLRPGLGYGPSSWEILRMNLGDLFKPYLRRTRYLRRHGVGAGRLWRRDPRRLRR